MPVNCFAAQENIVDTFLNTDDELLKLVIENCEEKEIDPIIVFAIIYNESRFQPNAENINTNGSHDRGLMQINDTCVPFLKSKDLINSSEDLFNPETNIICGLTIYEYHYTYTKDISMALLRYQVGEGAYEKLISSGQYTNSTHSRVMGYYEELKNHLEN